MGCRSTATAAPADFVRKLGILSTMKSHFHPERNGSGLGRLIDKTPGQRTAPADNRRESPEAQPSVFDLPIMYDA
jgi:hypothetical protein